MLRRIWPWSRGQSDPEETKPSDEPTASPQEVLSNLLEEKERLIDAALNLQRQIKNLDILWVKTPLIDYEPELTKLYRRVEIMVDLLRMLEDKTEELQSELPHYRALLKEYRAKHSEYLREYSTLVQIVKRYTGA